MRVVCVCGMRARVQRGSGVRVWCVWCSEGELVCVRVRCARVCGVQRENYCACV